MKMKIQQMIEWCKARPKKMFIFFMVVCILSLTISVIRDIFFPSQISLTTTPSLYAKSEIEKEEMKKNEARLEGIMKEIQSFQVKRKNGTLTKNDSMRIEYLFDQYKTLKNGH